MNQCVMLRGLITLVLVAAALFQINLADSGATLRQRRSATKSGRTPVADLFRDNCARCHGVDGAGDTPLGHTYHTPDFTDPDWWRTHSNITSTSSLIAIVTKGKGGMPAFGKKLTRSEIRQLVAYVSLFRNQKSSPVK